MAPRDAPRTIVHPLFLLEHAWEQWLSHPFIAACERRGVRPNAVTGVAFGLKLGAAPFMAFGAYEAAGGLWIVGAIADALDGALARRIGRETRLGAFLDAGLDRVASVALVGAFALGLNTPTAYQASMALIAVSLLYALAKAQARALGALPAAVRMLHRSGRSVWMSATLLLGPSLAVALGRPPWHAILLAFWALTAVTACALTVRVYQTTKALR